MCKQTGLPTEPATPYGSKPTCSAPFLRPSAKSGLLYVEMAGENNTVLQRIMVAVQNGLGRGYLALNETVFPGGTYTLRAYTNWMRNFDLSGIFQKQIRVNNYSKANWLVDAHFNSQPTDPDRVDALLRFQAQDRKPLSFRDLQIAITDGQKIWHRNTFKTDVHGIVDLNFKIPAGADQSALSLLINRPPASSSESDGSIPVLLNREAKIDLQFMPEGGECIAGLKNRIAFKAIGENGLGQEVSGLIYNSQHQLVDSFRSSHLGMVILIFSRKKMNNTPPSSG